MTGPHHVSLQGDAAVGGGAAGPADPLRPVRLDGVRPQHVGRYLQVHLVPPDTTLVRTPLQLEDAARANAANPDTTGPLVAPLLVYG